MFLETGKKFTESFSEIKNKKSYTEMLYRNAADDVLRVATNLENLKNSENFKNCQNFQGKHRKLDRL